MDNIWMPIMEKIKSINDEIFQNYFYFFVNNTIY